MRINQSAGSDGRLTQSQFSLTFFNPSPESLSKTVTNTVNLMVCFPCMNLLLVHARGLYGYTYYYKNNYDSKNQKTVGCIYAAYTYMPKVNPNIFWYFLSFYLCITFISLLLDIGSLMDLQQVCPALPLLCYTFSILKSILFPSHLQHPSIHPCSPCFILSSCIPVSLISVPMSP